MSAGPFVLTQLGRTAATAARCYWHGEEMHRVDETAFELIVARRNLSPGRCILAVSPTPGVSERAGLPAMCVVYLHNCPTRDEHPLPDDWSWIELDRELLVRDMPMALVSCSCSAELRMRRLNVHP